MRNCGHLRATQVSNRARSGWRSRPGRSLKGREKLEARSRALFAWIQQRAPQSAALKPQRKPVKLTGTARLDELEAKVERERMFATCTDPAVELQTVRDEIAVVGRQIAAAQAAEATAIGGALKAAEARSLALIGKRDKLAHRSRALCELVRVASPNHPALRAVVAPVDVRA